MEKLRILLCDDHAIIREGLRNLLTQEAGLEVVGEAMNGQEGIRLARTLSPDVIVMDIKLPDVSGVTAVEQIVQENPRARVLILTMYREEEYLFQTIRAGASGYLVKDAPFEEVVEAILKVAGGESFLHTPEGKKQTVAKPDATEESKDRLSPRESEVLTKVVGGLTNREIAQDLFITETTVKLHVTNIYRKLGVKSRSQAILVAVKGQLVNH